MILKKRKKTSLHKVHVMWLVLFMVSLIVEQTKKNGQIHFLL